jgi:radical SAM superfamily enzyme YgiQ (UPF0313 family)
MREAALRMSTIAAEAGCRVIVHGSDPVDHLAKYFDRRADFVLCGEGEHTLLELLEALFRAPKDLAAIPGLAFLKEGAVHRTPDRPVLRDLDSLPFPARDLVDTDRYRRAWTERHGYFSVNMVTTRGCPFHCNWCAKPLYGQVYNTRSPHNVVEEMLEVRETVRPDHLWFCDDIFGLKPGWVAAFADEVVRRNAAIPFKCLARVDLLLKENAVEHLRRAGCATVWVGAESGSQKILDAMEKGTTVEQIHEAARRLKSAGIRTGFFLQYGYPGETREDIARTLEMVRTALPDEIGVSVSYPLPGTPFYENVRAQMQGKQNWTDSQDLAMMFAGTYPADFYRALHRVTHKRFRIWHGGASLRDVVRHPSRIHRRQLRAIAAGVYHGMTLGPALRRMDALARTEGGNGDDAGG